MSLALGAAVIWLLLGVFNGVISAVHPRSLADRGLTAFALFFYSMPSFLLGLVLLYFLYFRLTLAGLRVVPRRRLRPAAPTSPRPWVHHMILPWFTLALVSGRDLHPADPRLDARRPRRGLHPDRSVEGHLGAAGDLSARSAQRA